MEIAYLAAPYNHTDPAIKKQRADYTTAFTSYLFNKEIFVFSPLTHNVPLIEAGTVTGWDMWGKYDLEMLSRCDKLIVLRLPGWKESLGVKAEIEHATKLGLPIEEIDPPEECSLEIPGSLVT
jgi:hypothetical protein